MYAASGSLALSRRSAMLSTPEKRFSWSRSERTGGFSLFGMRIKRRRERPRIAKEPKQSRRWKPAPWTPWLWVK